MSRPSLNRADADPRAEVDRHWAGRRPSAAGILVAILATLAAGSAYPSAVVGQEGPAAAPGAAPAATVARAPAPARSEQAITPAGVPLQEAELDSLLARVRERFQVYAVQSGVVLIPKYGAPGVQSVQVAGGTVAINGRAAAGGEIASLLGEDAPLVLRLSYVPPDQLAERAAASAPPADTGAGPGAPPVGAIVGADTAAEAAAPPGAPEAPELPEVPEPPELPERAFSGDIVRFGSGITIEEDETVSGDVVSIGGDVDVAGQVLGDAVSVGGVLHLRETARVMGDAVAAGGRLERDPGAVVMGQVSSVEWSVPFLAGRTFVWDGGDMFGPLAGFLFTLLWIALLLILGAIFILFLNRPLERVETNLRSSPLKAGLVGFLAQVLFLPAYVLGLLLLVITIIGIPIAVLWAFGFFIVGFLAALFGFVAAARATGHFFSNRLDRPIHSPYVALLIGLVILFLPILVGNLFNFGPGLMDFFSVLFMILGCVALYVVFTIGFGAVILTRFGTRTTWSGEPPAGYGVPTIPPPAPAPPSTEPFPEPAHRALAEAPTGRLAGEGGGPSLTGEGERPLLAGEGSGPTLTGEGAQWNNDSREV